MKTAANAVQERSLALFLMLFAIAVAFSLALLPRPQMVRAQLSCDSPPAPFDDPDVLERFQRVWDKTDVCRQRPGVFEEIISGGVPRDGIPPIDNPTFESIEAAATWLQPQSPVIAFQLGEEARAYPLAIMTRHEIVNDQLGDVPVAVTYCPLCNSALVFERRVEGQTLRFGVSGLLRFSDLVMWDDVTQSWWQQFTGEAIVGAHTGTQLAVLPSLMVGFGQFAEQFPHGQVLARDGDHYGSNPYVGYDSSDQPFLFEGELDERLLPTERVLAGVIGGEPVAYPFSVLSQERVVNDTVGGEEVLAIWQPGTASALDQSEIDSSRDVGMAALYSRELDGQVLTFAAAEDGAIYDEQTQSRWNVFGTAISGELEGEQLRPLLAGAHFWFAWAAFQPETSIYGQDE